MPSCEVCGKNVTRRTTFNNQKICWKCNWFKTNTKSAVERYDQLIAERISHLKQQNIIRDRLDVFSAIPPLDVLKKAMIALDVEGNYGAFSQVLTAHFKIPPVKYQVLPEQVPKGAAACYFPGQNRVASKGLSMSHKTAFHEFFHALHDHGIVRVVDEERDADKFALGCLKMLGEKE